MPDTAPVTGHPDPAVPRILGNAHTTTASGGPASGNAASGGARWKLAEPGRQLDANLIHLPPGQRIDTHAEPDLDVLLLVLAGDGTLSAAETLHLTSGTILWLPRGSSRSLAAGDDGMSYLTVHRRRPGMQIRSRGGLSAPSGALPYIRGCGYPGQTRGRRRMDDYYGMITKGFAGI